MSRRNETHSSWSSFLLSIAVHAFLLFAFTLGLRWKTSSPAIPQEIFLYQPSSESVTLAKPIEVKSEETFDLSNTQAEIALNQRPLEIEKKLVQLKLEEERKQRDLEKRKIAEKLEKEKQAKLEAQKKIEEQQALERKRKIERLAALKAAKLKKEAEAQRRRDIERSKQLEQIRIQTLNSLEAEVSSQSPSQLPQQDQSRYIQKIRNAVLSNISTSASFQGNPRAIVRVQLDAATGKILTVQLIRSSGNPIWDDTVVRAVQKTKRFPSDENGTVAPLIELEFTPN